MLSNVRTLLALFTLTALLQEKQHVERDLNETKIQQKESEIRLQHYIEMYEKERLEKEQLSQAFKQYLLQNSSSKTEEPINVSPLLLSNSSTTVIKKLRAARLPAIKYVFRAQHAVSKGAVLAREAEGKTSVLR